MDCRQTAGLMMRALDEELEPARQEALQSHLAHCARCRTEWARLQRVERLLREAPVVRPPVGFAGRVLARLDRRREVRRTALGGLALTVGTAVGGFLMLAPVVWTLPDLGSLLLALFRTGDVLLLRLADAAGTVLRSIWLTGGALLLPAAPLTLCSLVAVFVIALAWLILVRRVQPAMQLLRR